MDLKLVMHNRRSMKVRLIVAACLVSLMAACSSSPSPSSSSGFSLAGASVDPAYWCPGGATDAAYTVHATVNARNDTAKAVSIDSATADMVLASVTGTWTERVGDRYDAGSVDVSPNTVPAHSTAKLAVSIPSTCTSASYESGPSSSGDYSVSVHLVTSAGKFSITARNKHEIRAA